MPCYQKNIFDQTWSFKAVKHLTTLCFSVLILKRLRKKTRSGNCHHAKLPPIPIIQKHPTVTKIVSNHSKTLPSLFRYEGPNVLREIGHNSFEDLLWILLKQSWKSQKKNAAVKMILRILRFLRNQFSYKMISFY